MSRFVIAALPRSRTAWLANFLTTEGAFCYHDLSVRVGSMGDLRQRLSATPGTHVGVADTGLSIGTDFVPESDDGPLVLIERPPVDVMAACRAAFPETPSSWITRAVRAGQAGLDRLRPAAALVLPYAELAFPGAVEAIWHTCLPGRPWPQARYEQQAAFHIAIHPTGYDQRVTFEGADWLLRRMQGA